MINLNQEAIKILNDLDGGYMPGLAYDTAWAAMVPESNTSNKPLFPGSMLWLITNQYDDGSWGAEIDYSFDRLISTLASIIALKKTHKSEKFKNNIDRGEEYIWYNIQRLKEDPQETVGFELLFPALMNEAEELGLNLPYRLKPFEPLKEKKMKLAISDLIASRHSTVTFSLEFLGDCVNENLLIKAQNANGSISNSPAATAFMLTKTFNENAYNYLKLVLDFNGGTSMHFYPFDIFESSWVINFFMKAGIPVQNYYESKIENLSKLWTDRGVSWSKLYNSPDLDDTTSVFNILYKTKHNVDPKVFEYYESDSHFSCYPIERTSSPLVNIKVLKNVRDLKEYNRKDEIIEKILKYLHTCRQQNTYWVDKWHTSPYYCSGLALEAISGLESNLSQRVLDWIINSQNPNGSWGLKIGNMEETSYALYALMDYHLNVEKIDISVILNGLRYLEDNYENNIYPGLWISKAVYCPLNIIKASILATLYLGRKIKQ